MSSVLRACFAPIVLLLVAAGLAGCNGTIAAIEPALRTASAAPEETKPDGRRMIGKPYKVGGRWYTPREDEDYDETGIASWYGPGFHGGRTANGERYDQYALTAAHPTLPLPSYVRVTVLATGKSAVLRLNDRGPFKPGRIIDVSKAAAKKLDFKQHGVTRVRVEYLGPAPVGGSDRETLMAAAEFGEKSEEASGPSIRALWPFGRKDDEDKGRDVEVRVASAGPVRGDPPPGVRAGSARDPRAIPPEPSIMTPSAPSSGMTAVAYQPPESASPEGGAIDALITMNGRPEQAATKPAAPAAPLPAIEMAATEERIMGAHDLFGAIDGATGGAGELRGAGQ